MPHEYHWRAAQGPYRTRSGRWCVRWLERSSGRKRSSTFRTLTLARRAKRHIERELNLWLLPPGSKSWGAASEEHAQATRLRSRAHRAEFARVTARLQAFAGATTVGNIEPHTLDAFLIERAKTISPHSVAKEWRYLRAYFRWLVRRRYLQASPMADVLCPPIPRRIKAAPDEADWLRLLHAIPDTALDDRQGWHLTILLAVTTGLRASPILRIRLADITLGDAGSEHVGFVRAISKGDRESIHGLPRIVNDRVARRVADLPEGSERLFLWQRWPRKAWERLRRKAGFKFTFQSLRSASGTAQSVARALDAGAEHLGHSSVAVFADHYAGMVRIQQAHARAFVLPDLPPMPPFQIAHVPRSRRRWGQT